MTNTNTRIKTGTLTKQSTYLFTNIIHNLFWFFYHLYYFHRWCRAAKCPAAPASSCFSPPQFDPRPESFRAKPWTSHPFSYHFKWSCHDHHGHHEHHVDYAQFRRHHPLDQSHSEPSPGLPILFLTTSNDHAMIIMVIMSITMIMLNFFAIIISTRVFQSQALDFPSFFSPLQMTMPWSSWSSWASRWLCSIS